MASRGAATAVWGARRDGSKVDRNPKLDEVRQTVPDLHHHLITADRRTHMGSVIKKRRKRMAKKKHRKLLKKTRVQRRNKK